MEVKAFIKSKHSHQQSELYFSLPLPPPMTCPSLNEIKRQLKNSDEQLLLEKFRTHCDNIRKNVIQAKDLFWTIIDDIFVVDFPHQKIFINEDEKAAVNFLEIKPIDPIKEIVAPFSELVISMESSQALGMEVLEYYNQLLRWQDAYCTFLGKDKSNILLKVEKEFKQFKRLKSIQ